MADNISIPEPVECASSIDSISNPESVSYVEEVE